MMRRRILTSLFLVFCCVLLCAVCILTPSAKWPGNDELEEKAVLYEGSEYKYREEIINILFVGVDQFVSMDEINTTGGEGYADAILLVSIDTNKKDFTITVIPRDTMTEVFWTDDEGKIGGAQRAQINYQYMVGKTPEECGELMKQAVSTILYQTPIHRYCAMNYNTIEVVNDAVGGVEVEVLEDLTWANPIFVPGETVHLDGVGARQYVGARNTKLSHSNLLRLERQKQYLTALFEQTKSEVSQNPALVFELCWKLWEDMSTDISIQEMVYLVGMLPNMGLDNMFIQQIQGEQTQGTLFEEFYPDEDALKQMIMDNFYIKIEKE